MESAIWSLTAQRGVIAANMLLFAILTELPFGLGEDSEEQISDMQTVVRNSGTESLEQTYIEWRGSELGERLSGSVAPGLIEFPLIEKNGASCHGQKKKKSGANWLYERRKYFSVRVSICR